MKRIVFLFIALTLIGCAGLAGPQVTPEMESVEPVNEANNCKYIKTLYFEVSQPSWIHSYAAKNTVAYGGDSYKILNTTNDMAMGMKIYCITIAIYNCRH